MPGRRSEGQVEHRRRSRCAEGNPGLRRCASMSEPSQEGKNDQLWNQVLDQVARHVPPGHFDTWFQPLRFTALQDNVLQVTVPNEAFREAVLEHCSALLCEAAASV